MPKVKIVADSTCDLSKDLLEKYQIGIVPTHVSLDGNNYRDGVDIQADDILSNYAKNKTLPKTAAVSPAEMIDYFAEFKKECDEIVFMGIGSKFSSTYQNSVIAASEMEDVYTVDGANLSSGTGLLVLKAAELAQDGKSGADIVKEIEALAPKVNTSFLIDTLEFLYKGGRCSALAALGANLLQIKPCIEVKNGAMEVGKKYRGKIENALMEYVGARLEEAKVDDTRIFITHSGCKDEVLQAVKEQIEKTKLFKEIITTRAGCAVTTHCGPNTLGILFITK